jgi:Tol biopolymer transport system component
MGEVYRAHDSRLNREVAIKVLPPSVATDADRLARFTREAQTLAVLNHPNIATIHGVEEADGIRALVMEMVPGHDLSELLLGGPMALAEALPIARQIADALEAAHEHGIIHRDLKPGNIRIRPDGTVKVLDFGLAKALGTEPPPGGSNAANSPTITTPAMTAAGVILGTAAYMAPEQARGRPVDRRADIWAFGVVLYEMLTGTRLFHGESVAETLGAIFTHEPDPSKLPGETPPGIRGLIARCLVKDPRQRLRDIGDARLFIDDALAGRDARPPDAPAAAIRRPSLALWALPLVALAGAAAGWAARPGPGPGTTASVKLAITLPSGNQVTTYPAIAPDGQLLAYAFGRTPATSQLYLRSLNDFTPRAVADSVGADYPFFSPDGRHVAFFSGGKLRRASVEGGATSLVASAQTPWGGTWDDHGRIIYTTNLGSGLWRVPEFGGTPEQLTKPDTVEAGYAHVYPQRIPGSDEILFSLWGKTYFNALLSPATGKWRAVTPANRSILTSFYAANGHLLMGDGAGTVTAARWRPSASEPVRPATPVMKNVYWTLSADRPWMNVAENGTVAYVPGDPSRRRAVWVDRLGRITVIQSSAELLNQAKLSRNGQKVIYGSMQGHWVADLTTGTRTKIISEYRSWQGDWMPGDERIAISSNKDGDWDLYTVGIGGGEPTVLLRRQYAQHVQAVLSDGRVLFLERQPQRGSDLMMLSTDGSVSPLIVTPYNEESASVSPDDRFVAYVSDESGRREVYVASLEDSGRRVAVSIDGGTGPLWSRDGTELFYRTGDDLISVAVDTSPSLTLKSRRTLLDLAPFDSGYLHDFDVSVDGQRFLVIQTEPDARPTRIEVIVNWFGELAAAVR